MNVILTANGIEAYEIRLHRMSKSFDPGGAIERAMQKSAREIEAYIADRFEKQSDPTDMRWLTLADSTIEARERRLLLGQTRGAGRAWATMTRQERQLTSRQMREKKWKRGGQLTKSAERKLAKSYDKGGIRILMDTGHLRSSIHVRVVQMAFWILSDPHYLIYHQTGTKKMPQREILPLEPLDPMGKTWALTSIGSGGALWNKVISNIRTAILQ